jgi:hypothetical protein
MSMTDIKKTFNCIPCGYNCSRNSHLSKHLSSKKHLLKCHPNETDINCKFQCKKCNNKYKGLSGLWSHNKKCTAIALNSVVEIPDIAKDETVELANHVYLLREREFVLTKSNIYKIGRTNMTNCIRFNNYPKGSQLISINTCIDSVKFENILMIIFKKKFTQMTEYGREYFKGDVTEMKNEILKLLLDESKGYYCIDTA